MEKKKLYGVIEGTAYGHGSNSTHISGVQYTTYFNDSRKDWKIGDTVEFFAHFGSIYANGQPTWRADDIRKVSPSEIGGCPLAHELEHALVVVLCQTQEGVPHCYVSQTQISHQQAVFKKHYEFAKKAAEQQGFKGPMLAFDGSDVVAQQLRDALSVL
jgi:hypothetical protein